MKKYLLAGGLASILLLGACGEDEPEMSDDAVDTDQDVEQDGTAIDAETGEEGSEDDYTDEDEALDEESDVESEDSQ